MKLPRDRFVGVSPEGNATVAGQALEALDKIKSYIANTQPAVIENEARTVLEEIDTIIDQTMTSPGYAPRTNT
jgi:hypothetical protein